MKKSYFVENRDSIYGAHSDRVAHNNKDVVIDPTVVYWQCSEVARELGWTTTNVSRFYCKTGKLKCILYKKKYFIHPDDAEAFIEEHRK